ncbi:MAG: polysaccharide biosynthesis/export family protein [Bacteroidales bacterium]|nr:polysaccharide biosynthesis/export family protein [Bacteroidales bacterium]
MIELPKILSAFILAVLLASCSSYKQVPYLQESEMFISDSTGLYDAKIKPKDLLTITVSTSEPEAALPFNLVIPTSLAQSNSLMSQPTLQTYLVDNKGDIDFPILGKIHVANLTKGEVEDLLKRELMKYLKEPPVVNVRFVNYKISVLGEVLRPNSFTVANEKINVFEALALAGDMTIYGKRDNVKLIREDGNGKKEIVKLNLNDKNLINSPYFYLQQNDVLYVEPNRARSQGSEIGTMTTILISGTSIAISIASLLVNILK